MASRSQTRADFSDGAYDSEEEFDDSFAADDFGPDARPADAFINGAAWRATRGLPHVRPRDRRCDGTDPTVAQLIRGDDTSRDIVTWFAKKQLPQTICQHIEDFSSAPVPEALVPATFKQRKDQFTHIIIQQGMNQPAWVPLSGARWDAVRSRDERETLARWMIPLDWNSYFTEYLEIIPELGRSYLSRGAGGETTPLYMPLFGATRSATQVGGFTHHDDLRYIEMDRLVITLVHEQGIEGRRRLDNCRRWQVNHTPLVVDGCNDIFTMAERTQTPSAYTTAYFGA